MNNTGLILQGRLHTPHCVGELTNLVFLIYIEIRFKIAKGDFLGKGDPLEKRLYNPPGYDECQYYTYKYRKNSCDKYNLPRVFRRSKHCIVGHNILGSSHHNLP